MQVFMRLNDIVRAALTKDLRSAECPKIPCRFRGRRECRANRRVPPKAPPGRLPAGVAQGAVPAPAKSQ